MKTIEIVLMTERPNAERATEAKQVSPHTTSYSVVCSIANTNIF